MKSIMKRSVALTAGLLSTVVLAQSSAPPASNSIIGVWKLNLEASDFGPGPAPAHAPYRVYLDLGERGIANISFNFDPQGLPIPSISVSPYDGSDVPHYSMPRLINLLAAGGTSSVMQTYRVVDPYVSEVTIKAEDGGVMLTSIRTVSRDGRTFEEDVTLTSPQGETQRYLGVYDLVCGEGEIYTC